MDQASCCVAKLTNGTGEEQANAVLCSLKCWGLSRDEFRHSGARATSREEKGLRDICIFVVMLYVKA